MEGLVNSWASVQKASWLVMIVKFMGGRTLIIVFLHSYCQGIFVGVGLNLFHFIVRSGLTNKICRIVCDSCITVLMY